MHEHAIEHDPHNADHGNKTPAFIASVLAIFMALISLGGHRSHTAAILLQAKATDQWAYYQSSRIKLSAQEDIAELMAEMMVQLAGREGNQGTVRASAYEEKVKNKIKKYQDKSAEIRVEAEGLESGVHLAEKKANYFDIGEIFLEVAIVLCSMTFLTRRDFFWKCAVVSGGIGVGVAALSFMVAH
ncbi:MAG: DUF4337 domain-containing protein [Acidobacteria bacterium]|nr:DUF4337 domain-containing protein [Acidobacteriota bacterium]MBI3655944.1 DUF4337 domain-containing protein [Acidobacteriota bacterium]